jgi:hypothetical protein
MTTVLLDDAVRGRQTDAGTPAENVRRIERFEHAHTGRVIHPDAAVADTKAHVPTRPRAGVRLEKCAIHLDIRRLEEKPSALGHGFTGVPDKIEDQLLYLSRIGLNARDSGIEHALEVDPRTQNPLQPRTEIHEEPVQVE